MWLTYCDNQLQNPTSSYIEISILCLYINNIQASLSKPNILEKNPIALYSLLTYLVKTLSLDSLKKGQTFFFAC